MKRSVLIKLIIFHIIRYLCYFNKSTGSLLNHLAFRSFWHATKCSTVREIILREPMNITDRVIRVCAIPHGQFWFYSWSSGRPVLNSIIFKANDPCPLVKENGKLNRNIHKVFLSDTVHVFFLIFLFLTILDIYFCKFSDTSLNY